MSSISPSSMFLDERVARSECRVAMRWIFDDLPGRDGPRSFLFRPFNRTSERRKGISSSEAEDSSSSSSSGTKDSLNLCEDLETLVPLDRSSERVLRLE